MPWVCIDKNAEKTKIVLSDIENISEIKDNLIVMQHTSQTWGLFSVKNRRLISVIAPQYIDANSFNEGLIPVSNGHHWGYVNSQNHLELPFQLDYALPFSEEIAAVAHQQKWGMINRKGEWVVPANADLLRSFSDSVAVGSIRGTWFILNHDYRTILPPHVAYMNSFYHNIASINVGGSSPHPHLVVSGLWGAMDKTSSIVIKPQYSWLGNFKFGYAPYYREDQDQWGLVSPNGKEIIFAGVQGIREFSYGLAVVQKNNQWGCLNIDQQVVIDFQFSEIRLADQWIFGLS